MQRMREQTPEVAEQMEELLRQLIWQYYKRLSAVLARDGVDLTLPQSITLHAVGQAQSRRMGDLSVDTMQSQSTLTGIIDRLMSQTLVTRNRNSLDRRVVEVGLTPVGEERLSQMKAACRDDIAHILGRLSYEQQYIMVEVLHSFLHSLTNGSCDSQE